MLEAELILDPGLVQDNTLCALLPLLPVPHSHPQFHVLIIPVSCISTISLSLNIRFTFLPNQCRLKCYGTYTVNM